MPDVIYLTEAPAAGKSSLTRQLRQRITSLEIFEFGQRLTEYINLTRRAGVTQIDLRSSSGTIVTPEDVKVVDEQLIEFVDARRAAVPVIIDSHPVTKEKYGYRVTPYSLRDFERLSPTKIWVLYTDPEVAAERIAADDAGRPSVSVEEARFHTHLQASVATTYGMHLGIPVHFFEASGSQADLADMLAGRVVQ